MRSSLTRPLQTPADLLMLGAFGVYSFVYPFAILLMSFDWMPFGMEWMSSLLLVLLGMSCVGWLWANYGTRGLAVAVLLFVLGVGLEYIGVLTGFPFGSYKYASVLVPELPGGVPFAMGFAWLLIVISGSFAASRLILPGAQSVVRVAALSLLGALFAVGLDLLLEPVAYHVKGYWQWLAGSGGYYDIPWSNFVAWFVAAAAFAIPLALLYTAQRASSRTWLPVTLYTMNVVMFGIVNIAHGFWWPGLVGLILLGGVWAGGRRMMGRYRVGHFTLSRPKGVE
jgi:bisanhydrobacterioruberin hydratase